MRHRISLLVTLVALVLAGCGSKTEDAPEPASATQGGNVIKTLPPGVNAGPDAVGGGAPVEK